MTISDVLDKHHPGAVHGAVAVEFTGKKGKIKL
jgi:hypothetical protein